jgi:hypothetical protein
MGKYHLYKININSALFLLGFTGNETSLHLTIRGQWDWVSGGRHDQLVARGGARAGDGGVTAWARSIGKGISRGETPMNETISLSVPVPEELLLRVATLVPLLQRDPNISAGGKVTFTSALCLALERGLSTLEAEHFGGAEPMKEMEDH